MQVIESTAGTARHFKRALRLGILPVIAFTLLGSFGFISAARAQNMTDVVNVTVGGIIAGPVGAGFIAGRYGSVSPSVTSNGYSYQTITTTLPQNHKGFSDPGGSDIAIYIPSANPGQSWLASVSGPGGLSLAGSSATTYTYAAGVARWSWNAEWWSLQVGASQQFSVTHKAPELGYLNLKFQVLAVDYAPPGSRSNVSYSGSTLRGTSVGSGSSYNNTVSISISGDAGVNLFGLATGGLTATFDASYAQERGTTSSVSIQTTSSNSDTVPGPASSAMGVNHDFDVIWVWLNPVTAVYVGTNTVTPAGFAYNAHDDQFGMEVVPIQVRYLKNPSLMPAGLLQRLARSWDGSGLSGLNTADYAKILAADPFNSPSYNPNTDTSGRFQPVGGSTVPYVPAAPGGQPATVSGSIATQATTTLGKTSKYTYSVGETLAFSSSVTFIADFAQKLTIKDTYTTTDSWSSAINTQVGKTASYSVTGPASTDNYTGPVSFQVWRDNVYGSFMFYPL